MNDKTQRERPFGGDPQKPYFAVRQGTNKNDATNHAVCSVKSVRQRLDKCIGEGEADMDDLWLMRETLEAAEALLEACE